MALGVVFLTLKLSSAKRLRRGRVSSLNPRFDANWFRGMDTFARLCCLIVAKMVVFERGLALDEELHPHLVAKFECRGWG